jgi:hypothetical protein
MTQAIITPEARDASAKEYASSWGIDPSKHVDRVPDESMAGESGDGDKKSDSQEGPSGPPDDGVSDEYERAFNALSDTEAEAGDDKDDGDDDSDVDENAATKGPAK